MDVSVPTTADDTVLAAPPRPLRSWRWLAAGITLLTLLGAVVVGLWLLLGTTVAPAYRLAQVARGPVTAAVIASGTVNPMINVQVGSQVSGQIKELSADFNSQVRTGQLIARIDPALFETQVAQASADVAVSQASIGVQQATVERTAADLAAARATLESLKAQTEKATVAAQDSWRIAERARQLAQSGAGTIAERDTTQAIYDQAAAQVHTAKAQEVVQQATIQSAEAALAVARANLVMIQAQLAQKQAALDTAKVNLDHTYIRAPVDGTVVLRNVDVGQTVVASLQSPLIFTIAQDLRQMQVDSSVDEADVGGVKVGQAASFTVDAYPSRVFQGTVQQVRIAPQVVQNVVTYDVVVSAPNADLALLPGLTANIRIVTDHRDAALLVPNAALRYRPAGAVGLPPGGASGQVWVPGVDGRPTGVAVKLGISDGTLTEVVDGALQPGSPVIVGDQPVGTTAAQSGSPGMTTGPRF